MYAFINSMVKTLRKMGHVCETCTATRPKDLEIYFGQHYDAMLDIDSTLPLLKDEAGEYILDKIDAPFYNYLLDHPLYYHTPLESGMKRQNVLCLDQDHVRFVGNYYPNVNSVMFLPLGMMSYDEELIRPIKERKTGILFTGTYTSEAAFYKRLNNFIPEVQKEIIELLMMMVYNPDYTVEKAITSYIMKKGYNDPGDKMAMICNRYYLVDMGAAAAIRAKVVRTLLANGVDVTVCGHDWNKMECKGKEHMHIIPEKNYMEAVELAYTSKILLNVMPGFKAGIHDRIPTAMGHGAVSCSDGTEYLDKVLTPGKHYIKYDLFSTKALPDIITDKLDHTAELQDIADYGHELAGNLFTWEKRMEEWIESLP